jgi:hypothetical protein
VFKVGVASHSLQEAVEGGAPSIVRGVVPAVAALLLRVLPLCTPVLLSLKISNFCFHIFFSFFQFIYLSVFLVSEDFLDFLACGKFSLYFRYLFFIFDSHRFCNILLGYGTPELAGDIALPKPPCHLHFDLLVFVAIRLQNCLAAAGPGAKVGENELVLVHYACNPTLTTNVLHRLQKYTMLD